MGRGHPLPTPIRTYVASIVEPTALDTRHPFRKSWMFWR